MEETIGYEALFSREEWASMDFAEPSQEEEVKHSAFVATPPGTYEGNEERFELECE